LSLSRANQIHFQSSYRRKCRAVQKFNLLSLDEGQCKREEIPPICILTENAASALPILEAVKSPHMNHFIYIPDFRVKIPNQVAEYLFVNRQSALFVEPQPFAERAGL
jgi:hypothetical protein